MKNPAVLASLRDTGGLIDVQGPADYTRGFTKEIALTEVMMKKANIEAM